MCLARTYEGIQKIDTEQISDCFADREDEENRVRNEDKGHTL